MITDGRPQDDDHYPAVEMAKIAKNNGIKIFTIGVGNHINVTQENVKTYLQHYSALLL